MFQLAEVAVPKEVFRPPEADGAYPRSPSSTTVVIVIDVGADSRLPGGRCARRRVRPRCRHAKHEFREPYGDRNRKIILTWASDHD